MTMTWSEIQSDRRGTSRWSPATPLGSGDRGCAAGIMTAVDEAMMRESRETGVILMRT
jgi:hypothetical protein